MLNRMVQQSSGGGARGHGARRRDPLDRIFAALADPTRRKILRRLARGDARVGELARPHAISAPAVSKHLRVLEEAGLIRRRREGHAYWVALRTPPLDRAAGWLDFYEGRGLRELDALESLLTAPRRR